MEMTLAGRLRCDAGLNIDASIDAVLAPSGAGRLLVYAGKPRFVPWGETAVAVDKLGPAVAVGDVGE